MNQGELVVGQGRSRQGRGRLASILWLTAPLAVLFAGALGGCQGQAPSAVSDRLKLASPDQALNREKAAQLSEDNESQILFWSPEQQLHGYRNIDQIYPTRRVAASTEPYPLVDAPQALLDLTYALEGVEYTIADYVKDTRTAGLIVVHNEKVVLENYSLGNTRASRWMSFSIAKSVTSLLLGAAIKDGYITNIDEPITDYLPRLRGTSYANVSIRHVLNMASGVAWSEDYRDPESDVSRAGGLNGIALYDYLGKLPVQAPPGTQFNYSTGETNLVGALVRAAVGNNAAAYLQDKIWQPFGMEADATWMLGDPGGGEQGGCCLSATLRDYARLGLYALRNGMDQQGHSNLPNTWMAQSVKPSTAHAGYGNLWWLGTGSDYAARGIFGQLIHIDPANNLVIAMHSAWPTATGGTLGAHRGAVVKALTEHLTEHLAAPLAR